MRSTKWLLPALALIALLAIPASGQAKTVKVKPGQSIQAAVDAARPGDKIQVQPGHLHGDEQAVSHRAMRTRVRS